jgi:hypothetical protein
MSRELKHEKTHGEAVETEPIWFGRRFAYQHVGTFKGILFLVAVTLIVTVLVYSQILVGWLKDSTRINLQQKIQMYSLLVNSESPELIAMALEQIQAVDFPIIVTDSKGNPKHWKNVSVAPGDTSAKGEERLRAMLKVMKEAGNDPLPIRIGPN